MMETEYSKRVYQGVRVKHTVKDLLAEKRLRQTTAPRFSTSGSSSQTAFVPMPGSHVLPGYYSMRRPFLQDSEFCHPMKQYSPDTYSSALGSKGFTYDHPSSYPPFIDSYYNPDSYGDYRGPTSYATTGGALFPPSTLPTLLPSLTGEASSHLLLRDPWGQPSEDPVNQPEVICPEGPTPVPDSPSLGGPDSGGSSPYRLSSGRSGSSIPSSSQHYTLQPLEDVPYSAASYTSATSYSCPPYMTTPGDLAVVKMTPVSSEEASGGEVSLSDTTSWAKDDGTGTWLSYETRRAF
ncbi:POU domain class 2-associating factor 2 isoform X1 [Triplophysa dalaica]|uniref:POU domain class 2-associating factor 2 isoform X1 n=2 Tax=Triplophysa dalaica TaxID=1582913 RepID=UPI0024E03549|nr:POU domain class 2-associating factor 2 isoform X1 [Triplophysa dalaica]